MKPKPAEFQPDPPELPQVIVGACGCVLPTNSLPVGFRFAVTATGDKRIAVYACREHTRISAGMSTTVDKPKPKRAVKSK
jgi:hypothetical protein